MSEVAAWVGVGILSLVSIGGWAITYIRNTRSQATKFGNLEGKVGSLETAVQGLTTRIDNLINHIDKE